MKTILEIKKLSKTYKTQFPFKTFNAVNSISFDIKENEVFGAGKIKEGNNTLDVTVSGTITDASLVLDVVSMNPISRYNLMLDLSGNYATGEYQAFSASGDTWKGSAEGEKTA